MLNSETNYAQLALAYEQHERNLDAQRSATRWFLAALLALLIGLL